MKRDWLFLLIAVILVIMSFAVKKSDRQEVYKGSGNPVPAVCSLRGEVIDVSRPEEEKLPAGLRYYFDIDIKLEKIFLVSPRSPFGHPCTRSLDNKTVVTKYKTPFQEDKTPPNIDGIILKKGDIILGHASYAKGYRPLLSTIKFPEENNEIAEGGEN